MYVININGKDYKVAHDKKLLSYLRDDLQLTAAKAGRVNSIVPRLKPQSLS